MRAGRIMAVLGTGAVAAAAFALAPSLSARETRVAERPSAISFSSDVGGFTPAAADPKLAALIARSGLDVSDLRFTPAQSKKEGNRAVTVAVRARSARGSDATRATAMASTLALAPIAYNLGVSVGWKRFAVSGDVAHIDLGAVPGGRDSAEVGVSYTGKKVSGRVKAEAARPLADTPRLVAEDPSYSLDVGGSYSLTRNIDVTAGVRYKAERDRLPRLNDERRDSQAVYVGTAFRF